MIRRNATANSGAVRVSLVILATIFMIAGVYYASSIFAPLTFALLVLALVWPLQQWLEERMPQSAALFITLLVTIVFVLVFASMIAWRSAMILALFSGETWSPQQVMSMPLPMPKKAP